MKRVWGIAGAGILLLAFAWWFSDGPRNDRAPGRTLAFAPSPKATPIPTPENAVVELYLVPDGRVRAVANSVRIGLGYVSPDDAAAAPVTLQAQKAGPLRYEDLATVARWEAVRAEAMPDGRVKVGPVRLPHADRYSLTARGEDGLRFYTAEFTASTVPQSVSPIAGAGIRLHVGSGGAQVLLRRVGPAPPPASWQQIQQREAPALLQAFSDQALEVTSGQILAPLAPGPLEVVLQAEGVEAERKLLSLQVGQILDVRFDPINQAAARAVSAELQLELVKKDNGEPIRDLQVTWLSGPTPQTQTSDAHGRVTFHGVDRQKAQMFNLQAAPGKRALPEWPELQYLELTQDDLAEGGDAKTIRHRVELKPLQWLIARLPPEAARMQRSRGAPYPIYVLQRLRNGRWLDTSAAHFHETREGLAVSIADEGSYRIAAVLSPWRVLESSVANTKVSSRPTVDFYATRGTNVTVTILRDGRPLPDAPLHATGPLRSLPPSQLQADASGRVVLPSATVSRLWLEIPGSDQVGVALTGPSVLVDFGGKGSQ